MRLRDALPFYTTLKRATLSDIGRRLTSSDDPTQLSDAPLGDIQARFGLQRFAEVTAIACMANRSVEPAISPHARQLQPLGSLVPSLRILGATVVPKTLSRRTYNALRRSNIRDWEQLGELTLRDIRSLPGIGDVTLTELFALSIELGLRALLGPDTDQSTSHTPERVVIALSTEATHHGRVQRPTDQSACGVEEHNGSMLADAAVFDRMLVCDLKLIASWAARERGATTLITALTTASEANHGLPAGVQEAWSRLQRVDLRRLSSSS